MSKHLKEKIISAVFQKTEIWDQRHKSHHNRYVLDKSWAHVAGTCGITGKYTVNVFINN